MIRRATRIDSGIRLFPFIAALLVVGCSDSNPLGPAPTAPTAPPGPEAVRHPAMPASPGITALTWNVYVGAEIEKVLQARSADEAVLLATEEWMNVQATNFPARAGAIAAAIAREWPHLVGLEELALYRTTDKPFEELATHVAYDFLQLVLDSLRARGLAYTAAASDNTTDIQVPVIAGFDASGAPILAGVRFTDRDAVLVRGDVRYAHPRSGLYAAYVPVSLGDVSSGVYQGWSSVEATLDGRSYRFVVTHLAGQEVQDVQVQQTQELLALLSHESRPTILVGDFNSDAFGADPTRATPTYERVLAGGYSDAWVGADRKDPGLTCCEQADLLNPRPTFDQRIDFIFTGNLPAGALRGRREVVGDRPADRTPSGLWPSDHAAVVATFPLRRAGRDGLAEAK